MSEIDAYVATVQSARDAIPIAVQMEEIFPLADHFITEYSFDDRPKVWNTEVFIGNRYFLTMQVKIEIDYNTHTVKMVGEPKLRLKEYIRIDDNGTAWGGEEVWLTRDQWASVYKSRGDFSTIGVTLNPNAVPKFESFVSDVRDPRIPVSLISEEHNN